MTPGTPGNWRRFGEAFAPPQTVRVLLGEGILLDVSDLGDDRPSFLHRLAPFDHDALDLRLWLDAADPQARRPPERPRYQVTLTHLLDPTDVIETVLVETDDLDAAFDMLRDAAARLHALRTGDLSQDRCQVCDALIGVAFTFLHVGLCDDCR